MEGLQNWIQIILALCALIFTILTYKEIRNRAYKNKEVESLDKSAGELKQKRS